MNTKDIKTKLRRTATFIICRCYAIHFFVFDVASKDSNQFNEEEYDRCCFTSYDIAHNQITIVAAKMCNCSAEDGSINKAVTELMHELLLEPSAKGCLRHIADKSSKTRDNIRKYFITDADKYGCPMCPSDKMIIDLWRKAM